MFQHAHLVQATPKGPDLGDDHEAESHRSIVNMLVSFGLDRALSIVDYFDQLIEKSHHES